MGTASDFWDTHHAISESHDFWMAHPSCRRRINRRVGGNESEYPLDALYRMAGSSRFEDLLSLGCGTGRVERAVARLGIAARATGVDGSPVSIEIARARASDEELGIRYAVADLDEIRLPRRAYDAAVFHQSLHHVRRVERLLRAVASTLRGPAWLFLEEWIGSSRDEWTPELLRRADELFRKVPAEWRKWPDLRPPVEVNDPSEAVRSSAIEPSLRRIFDVVAFRPYGGQIVSVLLPQIECERVPPADLDRLVEGWLDAEEDGFRRPGGSFYAAILARPKRGARAFAARIAPWPARRRAASPQ